MKTRVKAIAKIILNGKIDRELNTMERLKRTKKDFFIHCQPCPRVMLSFIEITDKDNLWQRKKKSKSEDAHI